MDCENIKTQMPGLLSRELASDENNEILKHMEGCTQCRHEIEDLEETCTLMGRWEIDEPSATIKSRLMATVREELQRVHVPWWASLPRSFVFKTVLGALGFSMIIYLIFPYDKIINLCETNILNGGLLTFFPKGLIYFIIGLLYGLVPISISGLCFLKNMREHLWVKGLTSGAISAAFLVPFFLVRCPDFASGLISTMALGMIFGALSGGTGTFWVLNRMRMEEA